MGLQWMRPKFIASVISLFMMSPGESHGSFLMKDLVDGMKGLTLRSKPLPPKIQRRSFVTKSSQKYPQGVYIHATEDSVFKHVMQKDHFRNSFLSAVLGEEILESEYLDQALNPLKSFTALRGFINDKKHILLMKEVEKDLKDPLVINARTNRSMGKMREFLKQLAPIYYHLVASLPAEERNTQLDLICKTRFGLINVEVQVEPQNFWDIRILDHVCGLFHRQFPKGFKWSELKTDVDLADKVRKVVGISLFEKPPKVPHHLHQLLPWYRMEPWGEDELRRDFVLAEKKVPRITRSGLEFIDINLAAFSHHKPLSVLAGESADYREWLELLAHGHLKSMEEVEQSVSSPVIKEAYHTIRTLPKDVMMRYEEAYIKRQNISHYVSAQKEEGIMQGIEKGKEEGKKEGIKEGREEGIKEASLEIARNMLAAQVAIKTIIACTGLNEEEIKNLK
ncbi:Rpn family recombination-promoting nuclease/putative transposase [Candidatus Nucleicultrix amoebiphila]|uniref:Rpn family recombination-promoting nuclease/putative transposase n=1 Tax=Candidatus Nucleicultrix amoebiphila TaxID=1509244 RepID=UPI000A26B61C|nr:Rpn family recombination-promoting nuclease/putative transposase [Candidatus Nucleicultrix amoebiphila]